MAINETTPLDRLLDSQAIAETDRPAVSSQRKRTSSLDVRLQAGSGSDAIAYRTGSAPPRSQEQPDAVPETEQHSAQEESDLSALPDSRDASAAATGGPVPQVEALLADGLKVHKDRILLLRSDLEIEKFVNDASYVHSASLLGEHD